ncbi:MAG: thiamine pyrophosphate-dependent enzyme [Acidobacteriota bacterium]
MLTKEQVILPLLRARRDEIVVTTMGMVRPWGRHSSHDLDFASADSAMGHAADFALGLALAQPNRKVICLNGDGSMLMTLGTLATIVGTRATNLVLFVVQNHCYEITGRQPLPAGRAVDYVAIARAVGFPVSCVFDDSADYAEHLPGILKSEGPALVALEVEAGEEGPLARSRSDEPVPYLRPSLAESARQLRNVLRSLA